MKRNKSFTTTPFYLIATPIGNLSEISPRVIEVLNSVDFIACEDTRVAHKLLSYLKINKPLISLFEHNEKNKTNEILRLLSEGKNGAYLSDAGYPLVSDPGDYLVKTLINNDYAVSVVNGPSAFLPALVGSGLNTDKFYFYGFLPAKLNLSNEDKNKLKTRDETLIFYVSPHNTKETLNYLYEVLGNRNVCFARELTKINEEYIYGTLEEFQTFDYETIKGEMVLIIEGNHIENDNFEAARDAVKLLMKNNYSLNEATKIVALLYNVSKNKLYQSFI
jgi:16S rRNA (cytidine1402-2'-O)-methyltransferase